MENYLQQQQITTNLRPTDERPADSPPVEESSSSSENRREAVNPVDVYEDLAQQLHDERVAREESMRETNDNLLTVNETLTRILRAQKKISEKQEKPSPAPKAVKRHRVEEEEIDEPQITTRIQRPANAPPRTDTQRRLARAVQHLLERWEEKESATAAEMRGALFDTLHSYGRMGKGRRTKL